MKKILAMLLVCGSVSAFAQVGSMPSTPIKAFVEQIANLHDNLSLYGDGLVRVTYVAFSNQEKQPLHVPTPFDSGDFFDNVNNITAIYSVTPKNVGVHAIDLTLHNHNDGDVVGNYIMLKNKPIYFMPFNYSDLYGIDFRSYFENAVSSKSGINLVTEITVRANQADPSDKVISYVYAANQKTIQNNQCKAIDVSEKTGKALGSASNHNCYEF